jgi:hypothetical protein
MAFSSSSYIVGVGTAFAAIALGFAGGAMLTTSAVQPQNRLERVISSAPSSATPAATATGSSSPAPERASVTPAAQQPSPPVVAAAPSPAAESQPVQQPQPAAPVAAKSDAATNVQPPTNVQQTSSSPPPVAKNEDAAPARNERANARPAEANKEASRKRADERKFSEDRKFPERRRRQDLDEATNVVRHMRRDGTIDEVVERDEAPRVIDNPPRRFGLFGRDDDSPRVMNEPPPRFGLFGN